MAGLYDAFTDKRALVITRQGAVVRIQYREYGTAHVMPFVKKKQPGRIGMDTETLNSTGSRRMSARFEPKSYVTCYKCGTLLLKAKESDSIVYCRKCGASELVYLKDWMLIRIPAKLMEAEGTKDRLMKASDWLGTLMDAQTAAVPGNKT